MQRQFRHPYTVRYDEGNCYGLLTPAAFLRYMQDIAALDAEDAQLSGAGYWVARRTIISFAASVPLHTQLELTTFGIGFTRITAQRGYEARIVGREHNAPVVTARTLWVYLDMRGRPTRLPEQTAQIWLPDGPLPQQPEAPWAPVPEQLPDTVAHTVRFSDIDIMKHMNNAAYVEALDNAAWEAYGRNRILPDDATINTLDYDIEYVESARLGEQLEIQSWLDLFPAAGASSGDFSRSGARGPYWYAHARAGYAGNSRTTFPLGTNLPGLPLTRPLARAAARPALVRSRMRSRSNAARAPIKWKMSLPPGVSAHARLSRRVPALG